MTPIAAPFSNETTVSSLNSVYEGVRLPAGSETGSTHPVGIGDVGHG
jgi:hypothetical protein